MGEARRVSRAAGVAVAVWALVVPLALAGPPKAEATPAFVQAAEDPLKVPLDEAARALIDAEYLKPEERLALKLKHGVFEKADLVDPLSKARAAALVGRWDDPSLSDPAVPAEDRAEAMVWRGEYPGALALVKDAASAKGIALRVMINQATGQREHAKADAQALVAMARGVKGKTATDLLWIVRGLTRASRLEASSNADNQAAGFKSLLSMLGSAREQLDKLDPFIPLAEAELLWEKDNPAEAGKAMETALSLNPANAAAWSLLGSIKTAQFDFATAEDVVKRLGLVGKQLDGNAATLEGELVRARMRLKQLDAQGAADAADKVLAVMPGQPTALSLRAAAAAALFDFASADSYIEKFATLYPGSGEACAEVGKVLSDQRQYADSERYFRKATAIEPAWAQPAVELGLMLVQAGKDADAREVLRTANLLDPFNVRTENSLKLVTELATYKTIETEHFVIRYKPGTDEVMAREMGPVLEKMYARVTGSGLGGVDYQIPGKTTIELMPDHHWFSVRITGMPQVHTIAAATGPVIAMESPREGAGHKVGPYDWPRVLQHEFTHTVGLARAKNRLPHWFTEAQAQYLEDAPRDWSTWQLLARIIEKDECFDFEQINIAFVRPEKPSDRQQAYAQGHWMYDFMIEKYGGRAPLELLDRYAKGQREAQAVQEVLGVSREEFLTQFKAWAKAQLVATGMIEPEGMPGLDELMTKAGVKGEPTQELVQGWLKEYPEHPDLLQLAVMLSVRDNNGKPTPALAPLLQRAAKARPADPLPHKLLAQMYLSGELESGSADDAIAHLDWLDVREQYSTTYAVALAKRYAEIGDWANASKKAERATRIAPFDPSARELAASVAIKDKDLDRAERHIRALMALEPEQAVHAKRLEALLKMKVK